MKLLLPILSKNKLHKSQWLEIKIGFLLLPAAKPQTASQGEAKNPLFLEEHQGAQPLQQV